MKYTSFNITQIDNVYVFTELVSGFYNNITIIRTATDIVLIDTFKSKALMEEVMMYINLEFQQCITKLVYTHWHVDHIVGSSYIDVQDIYSTLYTKDYIESFIRNDQQRLVDKGVIENDVQIKMPTVCFDSQLSVMIDNKLEFKHIPGHTYDSMVILYNEVVIVGDTLLGDEVQVFKPPVIPPDSKLSKEEHLYNAIEYIQELNCVHIIPGHGSVCSKEHLIESNLRRLNQTSESINNR